MERAVWYLLLGEGYIWGTGMTAVSLSLVLQAVWTCLSRLCLTWRGCPHSSLSFVRPIWEPPLIEWDYIPAGDWFRGPVSAWPGVPVEQCRSTLLASLTAPLRPKLSHETLHRKPTGGWCSWEWRTAPERPSRRRCIYICIVHLLVPENAVYKHIWFFWSVFAHDCLCA